MTMQSGSNTNDCCREVSAEWMALLDEELGPEKAQTLWDHIRQCGCCSDFIGNQKQFNQCVERVLRGENSPAMPAGVKDRLLRALDGEAPPLATTIVAINGGWRRIGTLFPVGIAAMLALALTLAAVYFNPAQALTSDTETVTLTSLERELIKERDRLVLASGSHDIASLSRYAKLVGFQRDLPAYDCGRATCKMDPVNVSKGTIFGMPFRAICFCSGDMDCPDATPECCPFSRHRKRFVLFMIDGAIPLPPATHDGRYCVSCDAQCTTVAWREGKDMTCIAMMMAGIHADEARQLVAPITLSK